MKRLLTLHETRFAVCGFPPDAPLPTWVFHDSPSVWCVMRTPEELSVVCPEDDLPPSVTNVERGWRAFALAGPIPFEETGVLAGLVAPLARAGVPVFALSTHRTDWLLVKERDLEKARAALAESYELR